MGHLLVLTRSDEDNQALASTLLTYLAQIPLAQPTLSTTTFESPSTDLQNLQLPTDTSFISWPMFTLSRLPANKVQPWPNHGPLQLVVTSKEAAKASIEQLQQQQRLQTIQATWFVLSAATKVLVEQSYAALHLPAPSIVVADTPDSEGLLATLKTTVPLPQQSHILILRAQNGREWLYDALRSLGYKVEYRQTYCRHLTTINTTNLIEKLAQGNVQQWERLLNLDNIASATTWLISSSAVAKHLVNCFQTLGLLSWFQQQRFLCTHAPIHTLMIEQGCQQVLLLPALLSTNRSTLYK